MQGSSSACTFCTMPLLMHALLRPLPLKLNPEIEPMPKKRTLSLRLARLRPQYAHGGREAVQVGRRADLPYLSCGAWKRALRARCTARQSLHCHRLSSGSEGNTVRPPNR